MQQSAPQIGIAVSSLPIGQIIPVFFTLVFVVWAIYTLVAAYHWIRYSSNILLGLGAIAAHLAVSSMLAIYAVSGLH
jgi:hypothetical protein